MQLSEIFMSEKLYISEICLLLKYADDGPVRNLLESALEDSEAEDSSSPSSGCVLELPGELRDRALHEIAVILAEVGVNSDGSLNSTGKKIESILDRI